MKEILILLDLKYITKDKMKHVKYYITTKFRCRLQAYKHLAPLRLLICGGDGSVGWVLKEIDKLHMKVRLFAFIKIWNVNNIYEVFLSSYAFMFSKFNTKHTKSILSNVKIEGHGCVGFHCFLLMLTYYCVFILLTWICVYMKLQYIYAGNSELLS